LGAGGNLVALAGLSALLASAAQAQIVIGGHGGPAVSVDDSVLERLGPPITLPQFFLGERNPSAVKRQVATNQHGTHSDAPRHRKAKRHVATRSKKHPTSHKTAIAKAAPARTAKAPVRMAAASSSSLNQIIHLIPPKSRVASAMPAPAAETGYQQISHQEVAISAPTMPAVVALVAPAPMPSPAPKQPASNDIPTPAMVAPQQARVETPSAPVAPSPQSVAAAAPPAAAPAPTVIASAAPMAIPASTLAPSPTVSAAPPPVPPMTIAVATPAPSATITAAPPAVAPPPVQMAAATTLGSAATALKFKSSVTDLGNGAQPILDAIVARLLANESLRVQLVSHATGGPDDAMEARRVSLARAVAVRAYLIDKGVRSLRIDVRALGNRADNGPAADQVDLLVVSQ
jgi:outer membrane protein OmpA-like peptidoglycan-associated protein